MTYNLWETNSRNLVHSFESELEALAFVRDLAAERGADAIESWALMSQDDDRHVEGIAAGDELVARARRLVIA